VSKISGTRISGVFGSRTGKLYGKVWRLSVPIMLANLSVPLLGAVDTAVVGHLPDPASIGGVALGSVIFSFLYWGFGFLRMGTTGFTAQALGAGNDDEVRAALARPLLLGLLLSLALVALQDPIAWIALWAVEGSPAVEAATATYYHIRIWSAPAALVNFTVLGWLLGMQRTGISLCLQLLLNGTNILLDLLFVLGLGWGIAGVAAATVIAESLAAAAGLALVLGLMKRHGGHWDLARILRRDRLWALLRVNLDIFVRTVALLFAFAGFTAQGARMGDNLLAANAILMNLFTFIAYGLDGFAHAAEILAGNAVGAAQRQAFRSAVRSSTLCALGMSAAFSVLLLCLGPDIVGLYSDIPSVRDTAIAYLPWVTVAPLLSVWCFQLDGIFIGATRTAAMRNAAVASLLLFIVASWLLVPAFGNHGLWLALMIFTVGRALTLGVYYPALERSVTRPTQSE